ncbi:hypothetical protein MMC34_008616 [Xylographa carneopallida]|nr:hypothetical protein [Xylographa carneopallida]
MPSTAFVAVALHLSLLLCLAPSALSQPPVQHTPDQVYHGWFVSSFAASRNPSTLHLYCILDNGRHVVQLDARDGRSVANASFWAVHHRLSNMATDSSGRVFVVANSTTDTRGDGLTAQVQRHLPLTCQFELMRLEREK